MSEKATKRQFEIQTRDAMLTVRKTPFNGFDDVVADFFGPDREANARKFLHMDELVEALKPRLSEKARNEMEEAARAEEVFGSTTLADAIRFVLAQEDRRDAILSKIEGKP